MFWGFVSFIDVVGIKSDLGVWDYMLEIGYSIIALTLSEPCAQSKTLRMKKIILVFPLLLLFLSCSTKNNTDERTDKIDSILRSLQKKGLFNGNLLIAEKGEIIYEKSFGYSDIEQNKALNSKSIFNIASVSKLFTVVGIMVLEEEGKLNLNDRIIKYLPEIPYENISVKNLLTHTSGLPRIQSQPFRNLIEGKQYDNTQIINTYTTSAPDLHFEAGTNYFYSNTNYIFLALIIEQLSNQNFNQFLKTRIFEKAGMTETFLRKKRVPKEYQTRIVSNYTKPKWLSKDFQNVNHLESKISDDLTFGNDYGASSVYTTTGDLLKFHSALQNEVLLKSESLKKMYSPNYLSNAKEYTVDAKSNYPSLRGLGWCIAKDKPSIVYHAGGIVGSRSFFIRNMVKDQCIVILTNNQEMNRYNFTFPMKILSEEKYQLDPISLPKLFAKEYIENGIEAALTTYSEAKSDTSYIQFVDWDFEEIGQELMSKKEYFSAIELYKLYTEQYPEDEYSWSFLGDSYYSNNNLEKALENYKKSFVINPEHKHAKEMIEKLKK